MFYDGIENNGIENDQLIDILWQQMAILIFTL
jgi:hypothetical protein